MLFICASVVFGLAAPKSDPNWPDPVPFLKNNKPQKCPPPKAKSATAIMMKHWAALFRRMIRRFYMEGKRTGVLPGGNEGYIHGERLGGDRSGHVL